MIPQNDGIFENIDINAYHGDKSSLSVSGAKLLLPPSCPALFKWVRDNGQPARQEFDFGTVAHQLLLGKGAEIVEIDAPDFRSKAAREARDKAREHGQVPILSHELATAHEMVKTVLAHPVAGEFFNIFDGVAEASIYATDPETGVRLRCRPDWIYRDDDGRTVIVDYKTSATASPDLLVSRFHRFGYHMQAAWYKMVTELAGVAENPRFLFVTQMKEPPYLVTVVELDALAEAEGRRANREAIDLYATCCDTGEWPGFGNGIVTIGLPNWATSDLEIEL